MVEGEGGGLGRSLKWNPLVEAHLYTISHEPHFEREALFHVFAARSLRIALRHLLGELLPFETLEALDELIEFIERVTVRVFPVLISSAWARHGRGHSNQNFGGRSATHHRWSPKLQAEWH